MPYAFTPVDSDIDHFLTFYSGCESIVSQVLEKNYYVLNTKEEYYASTVLDLNGIKLNAIDGVENFVMKAIHKFLSMSEWVHQWLYLYGLGAIRILGAGIKKVNNQRIYKARTAVELAKECPFKPAEIVDIIYDPNQVAGEIEIKVNKVKGNVFLKYNFLLDSEALLPVIKLARDNKTNAEKVRQAIKSAGSVDKLISKHIKNINGIDVDTNAFKKAYAMVETERNKTVEDIISLIKKSDKIIKRGENAIAGKVMLNHFPTNLRGFFHIAKGTVDFQTHVAVVNGVTYEEAMPRLPKLYDQLNKDIKVLEKFVNLNKNKFGTDGNENVINDVMGLINVYKEIAMTVTIYAIFLNDVQQKAIRTTAEALYKIIIASAKAEVSTNQ